MKMSLFYFGCMISTIILFNSCQKKSDKKSGPYLKVNTLSLSESFRNGKDSLEINSDNAWAITAPKWISLPKSSGMAGTSRVYLNFNTNNINTKLSGDIIITSDNKDVLPVTIRITQEALVPYLNLDKLALTEKASGQLDSVTIDANVKWQLSVPADASWITTRQTTEVGGKTKIYINTTVNSTGAVRTTQIKFTDLNNNLSAQVLSITQLPDLVISNFYPAAGTIGSSVTIHGFFDNNPTVKLNGVDAVITNSSTTDITFVVPTSTTGKIAVVCGTATLTSVPDFIVSSPGKWTKITNSFPGGLRYDFAVSFVSEDKIYYGLGTNGSPYNNDFKIYDYKTNTWSQGPVLSASMNPRKYASAFVLGTNAYVGMGAPSLSDWWKFDIRTALWTQVGTYRSTGFAGTCFVVNNTAFFSYPKTVGNLDRFDQLTGTWVNLLTTWPQYLYASTFVIGNYGYMVGGSYGTVIKTAVKYDQVRNIVTSIADFPVNVSNAPSFALGNYGYVLFNGSTFRYDPNLDSWTDMLISTPVFSGVYNATVINGIAYAWLPDGTMYQLVL